MRRSISSCAAIALTLLGCGDRLPSEPESGNLWEGRGKVFFTQGVTLSSHGRAGSIAIDGTDSASLFDGLLLVRSSRNGKILYATRDSSGLWPVWPVHLADIDGGNARKITPGDLFSPVVVLSPQGDRVAVVVVSKRILNVINTSDTTDKTLISDKVVEVCFPVFSPDGAQLAFYERGASESQYDVRVANLGDGSSRVVASNARPWAIDNLDWHGSTIAYVGVDDASSEAQRDIFVVDANGGAPRNITSGSGEDDRWPIWSPDGSRIAFIRNSEIWTMDSSGAGARQVTFATQWPYQIKMYPQWSPDGSMILFTAGTNVAQGALLVTDLRTRRVNALVTGVARGFWGD